MTTLAIHGAAGRMGLRLIALAHEDPQLKLVAALDRAGHPALGQDAGRLAGISDAGVPLSDRLGQKVDAVIDFSTPAATRTLLQRCVETRSNLVIGTTGLTEADHRLIDDASRTIAVLQAPNMSLGVNLLFALAGQIARQLGDDYDIEITETHHRFKKDAPSGTALGIAEAICKATGKNLNATLVHGRHGDCPRTPGQIGVHTLRSGDIVGKHTVSFGTLGEELQLTHTATTRDIFARGALHAAKWLANQNTGRYDMKNVLGL